MSVAGPMLVLDGMNFMHRARSGFQLGAYSVVYNAFRNLRAVIEQFQPSRAVLVLEGHPKKRFELLPEYKANRRIVVDEGTAGDPEVARNLANRADFHRQVDLVVDLVSRHFPISVVHHPDHECDDVVHNLILHGSTIADWIVVSNDSDFTQLLQEFTNVRVYNPMRKVFIAPPDYDYVTWKALRGDGSDNIPGLPGIGDQRARELMDDPARLAALFNDRAAAEAYTRNYALIKFASWTDEDAIGMVSSSPRRDWDVVRARFTEWSFRSLLKDGAWSKFVATFDPLFACG